MRTYDVVAFQIPPNPLQPSPQKLWELDGAGRAVTGILKLAQHALLELLTVKGSRPFNQASGTSLLSFVRQGLIRNEVDAYVYFQYAVGELQQNLLAAETAADPDDERFVSLVILSVTFTPQQVSYRTQLTSRAGTARELILPVATAP
jgi:hypothetical protein